jgi:hypothetical protein
MKTFKIDCRPSVALLREVHRRGLSIFGHLDEYKHPEHPEDPRRKFRPFMLDENPVWVLDVGSGLDLIWESDQPAFDHKLHEYGQDPNLVRETTVEEATQVAVYRRDGRWARLMGHEGHALFIARHLGFLDKHGKEMFSIGLPCPVVIAAMVELAEQRDGKVYYDLEEIQANRGIIRFMQAVPLLPDWCRFGVNLPNLADFHLATEPPLIKINKELLGSDATTEAAEAMVRALVARGYNVALGAPMGAERPSGKMIKQWIWEQCLMEINQRRRPTASLSPHLEAPPTASHEPNRKLK